MELKQVVLRELNGQASEEDLLQLNEDYEGWNNTLTEIYQQCCEKMVHAKSQLEAKGRVAPARVEYESTKANVVNLMTKVTAKKRLVKELLRDERVSDPGNNTHGKMLQQILEEVYRIHARLDAMQTEKSNGVNGSDGKS